MMKRKGGKGGSGGAAALKKLSKTGTGSGKGLAGGKLKSPFGARVMGGGR